MRLRQIRISGFKSFADLTTIELASSLIGIVGPNGCGKSNVIEAVQWAMGEGRASDLRAKQMGELVFAGSAARKPSSRAMVELIFDNADKTLAGPWGAFSEISVRRVLTRDNLSAYFINGHQVRATDVRDLFMGTGLGANSYAIVSQGRIEDFANASPETRREYLEEAAGVSKYKKRRHEAELRLEDTRENLERAKDIQVTRTEALEKLKAQAAVAARYDEIEKERTKTETLYFFAQAEAARNEMNAMDARAAKRRLEMDEINAKIQALEVEKADVTKQLAEANTALLAKTEDLAAIEREIAGLEAKAREAITKKTLLEAQKKNVSTYLEKTTEELRSFEAKKALLIDEIELLTTVIQNLKASEKEAEEQLSAAKLEADNRSREFQKLTITLKALEKEAADLSTKIALTVRQKDAAERDAADLANQLKKNTAPDFKRLAALKDASEKAVAAQKRAQEKLTDVETKLNEARNALDEKSQAFASVRETYAGITSSLKMIEDLERQSLASGKLSSWLDKNGLTDLKRFFEEIEVPPEWGTALEAVLREKAQAIAVSRLESASGFEALPPPARLTFYVSEKTFATAPEGSLLNLVQGEARTESVLAHWLAGVFVAEDIASARALLKTLPEGSLVVTKAGHLLEKDAVTFWSTSQETGNLKRRAQIKALREKEKATADEMKDAREALDAAQRAKNQEEARLFEAKRALTQYESEAQRLTREVTQLEADIRIYETRKGDIEKRLADARERATSAQTALAALEKTFDAADAKVLAAQEKVSDAEGAFEKSRQALTHAERHVESVRFAIREKENRLNVARERSAEADRSREMSLVRIGDFQNQLQTINDALAAVTQEDTAQETEALTKKRDAALIAKEAAAQGVTDIQNAAQTQTEQTKALASQKEAAQNALATIVADRQRFEIDFATATSRLPESADLTALRETFESERPKLTSLKARVEALSREAASLGAVNHAALEELTTQKALVENVNAQIADLEKALETITSAITKIDAQTRAVLRQTFDRVNTAFGTLFAELFKGGEAYLKFTDDDVLSAGVEMFASPPGKRLKSIMQLSGGELTLTATALVFAFFTLNPAPFCLLDEADAPLDEANQERLAGLIEKMSANTQFMMITHHRVSMSHMAQLIGVTMREAGVSRVVSVDIAQADGFVEKGAS